MKRSLLFLGIVLMCTTAVSQPASLLKGKVEVVVVPIFNSKELNSKTLYVDAAGDSLHIATFRFYLSHIDIAGGAGDSITGYHLVDAELPATQRFYLNDIPVGSYSSFQFTIGVDSLANVSGALSGDLDPSKGMYWAWNTGYIMAKLEGTSSICKTLHHEFQFHIGGYLPPFNASRNVTLQAPTPIVVAERKTTTMVIYADAAKWLNGATTIHLKETNDVVMPGKQSMSIADNYEQMFRIAEIKGPQ